MSKTWIEKRAIQLAACQFSAGPWEVRPCGWSGRLQIVGLACHVAEIYNATADNKTKPDENAALIAAAPRLYWAACNLIAAQEYDRDLPSGAMYDAINITKSALGFANLGTVPPADYPSATPNPYEYIATARSFNSGGGCMLDEFELKRDGLLIVIDDENVGIYRNRAAFDDGRHIAMIRRPDPADEVSP